MKMVAASKLQAPFLAVGPFFTFVVFCSGGDVYHDHHLSHQSSLDYRSELRPSMSGVLRMLEGVLEIPKPLNHFQTMMVGTINQTNHSSNSTLGSGSANDTLIML